MSAEVVDLRDFVGEFARDMARRDLHLLRRAARSALAALFRDLARAALAGDGGEAAHLMRLITAKVELEEAFMGGAVP